MNTYKIYISSVWKQIQKLFKSGGEGFLLLGKVLVGVVLVVGYGESRGQENGVKEDEILALRVGDRVPEEFWTREFSIYGDGMIIKQNLMKYKGKPLVLDFWASWCGACIQNFPKLDNLKEIFGDDINFLLINSDSNDRELSKIDRVFTDDKFKEYRTNISSIVFDDYLINFFPHDAIPHYIWLDHTGSIRSISTFDFVSQHQIQILINRSKGIWE